MSHRALQTPRIEMRHIEKGWDGMEERKSDGELGKVSVQDAGQQVFSSLRTDDVGMFAKRLGKWGCRKQRQKEREQSSSHNPFQESRLDDLGETTWYIF